MHGCSAAKIYLFKANNKNARKRCKICSKLTIKTPERRHKMVKHTQALRRLEEQRVKPLTTNVPII